MWIYVFVLITVLSSLFYYYYFFCSSTDLGNAVCTEEGWKHKVWYEVDEGTGVGMF